MIKDMNFFAPYQGQKKEQKNKNIYVYSLVGFLSVVVVGSLAWNSVNIILVNNKIKTYNEKLEEKVIKEKLAKWDDISKKNSILTRYDNELSNIVDSLNTREVVTTEILDKLSSTLPTEVTFNSISITNTEISIQAVSTSRVAIGEIEHNLKNLNNVQDVYIGGISGDENYTFDIKCVLKDVE
ncbi:PilN domain-containing protein [Clostridium sp. AL.422]|uniref:PilN domain-containing protein n=1 Tax=Clostridium TaxID=1485 RepID=UPI00293DF852|nr:MULTISPECIES: PilN domain-containing protein [unclassified Clostridium]MDV4149365.1 PilN domain-containing protein [Clostridium sp. AL.422]